MAPNDDASLWSLMIVEYERLKEEQKVRIGFRDNLLYVTIASMAAVVAAALQTGGHANLMLLLPPVAVVLGWTYLVNDEKISAIGRYIREDLSPRLQAIAGAKEVTIFGWEWAHRSDRHRRSRKYLQLFADLCAFCLTSLASITIYLVQGPWRLPFLLAAIFEVVAVAVLAVQIILYADIAGGERVPSPAGGPASDRGREKSFVGEAGA